MTDNFAGNSTQVYIRLDHGAKIGEGHLFRCKALAAQLVKNGYHVAFVTRPRDRFVIENFFPFNTLLLSGLDSEAATKLGDNWLGVDSELDALECLELVKKDQQRNPIWIVDHYGANEVWENTIRKESQLVIAIDDLTRVHSCDIVIDQNITANAASYRQKLTNQKCLLLLGPEYSLLREEFASAPFYSDRQQRSYLLNLGSSPEDLFFKVLNAIRSFSFEHLNILNPPPKLKVALKNETIIGHCTNMAELYLNQKLVFGSCGVANIERMALAVPTITSVIVDNQIEVGNKINELDLNYNLGDVRTFSEEEIRLKIEKFLKIPRIEFITKARAASLLINRNGASKIIETIEATAAQIP